MGTEARWKPLSIKQQENLVAFSEQRDPFHHIQDAVHTKTPVTPRVTKRDNAGITL